MELEQLIGRYSRLLYELGMARIACPPHPERVARLSDDVASTARAIARLQAVDEQCDEALPGYLR